MIRELPLTKVNRIRLARVFRGVPRVDMSLECAIEGQMGQAYVDDPQTPSVYRIQIGPFFYFAGNPLSPGGQEMLRNIQPWTLFMPSSEGWAEAGETMYAERFVPFARYSFSSTGLSLEHLEKLTASSSFSPDVKRIDLATAAGVWGQDHFLDLSDFESPSDFVERSIGYCVEREGKILGAAYGSLVCSKGIEVSIFVSEGYRLRGMATALAAHLIKWCLEHNMDANWDAANPESCRLAEKLGYTAKGSYQAYYLKA